jgi:hypothetical protein
MEGVISKATELLKVKEGSPNRGYKNYIEVQNAAKGMKEGGKVSSASKRADGCAIKGKTKGRMV